jgi:hypothetical protein
MRINVSFAFSDTLKQAQAEGKGVTLHLRSGERLQGKVEAVAPAQVVIAEIVGREFYSAVVRLEEVAAIEVRVRDR